MDYTLYFGRFSEEKGIGTLIKVCKELPDVQFIFAGTGPLEDTINGVSNIKNVEFQRGEALEKLIREARFSIYPSEWYENCPLTASGADAYLLHVTTTPSVAYIARVDDFDCGIMISASHNPFYDNGIKLIDCYGEKMPEETLLLVEDYIYIGRDKAE